MHVDVRDLAAEELDAEARHCDGCYCGRRNVATVAKGGPRRAALGLPSRSGRPTSRVPCRDPPERSPAIAEKCPAFPTWPAPNMPPNMPQGDPGSPGNTLPGDLSQDCDDRADSVTSRPQVERRATGAEGLTAADRPARSPAPARRRRTRGPAAAARGGRSAPAPRRPGRTRAAPATACAPSPRCAQPVQVLRRRCTPGRR